MSLIQKINKSLDNLFSEEEKLSEYKKAAPRKYRKSSQFSENEIWFYTNKWWDKKKGGELYAELFCFIPEIQHMVHGTEQSWDNPDYSKPVYYFQYRSDPNKKRDSLWEIQSSEQVGLTVSSVKNWMTTEGLEWFENFQSFETVISWFKSRKRYFSLAELSACLERNEEAFESLELYLKALPRQINVQLERLLKKNLLSQDDFDFLLKASIQSEEEYMRRVNEWLVSRRSDHL